MERGVPIRAVCRSIAALQAINRHGALTLTEIASQIDLPYPTACRIVQTLMHEGLVENEPHSKRYRPTALVQSLSVGFHNEGNMPALARPLLVGLTQKISWPVAIATRVGPWMMVRDSTHALSSLTFNNYAPGYTLPILESACGHAYLAHATADERECVLNGIAETDAGAPALGLFQSGELAARIRADGYATYERNLHSQSPGKTSSLSVPVFERGRLASTLTLTFFASAMPLAEAVQRYLPELNEAAAAIGARLSGAMPPPAQPRPQASMAGAAS